jgi:hypothetical protein
MRISTLALLSAVVLAGCGSTVEDRSLSGAGIGAGIGLLAGPPGVIVGGLAGATTGAVTDREDVDLGKPVWRQ